jgi:hypothetical protein
LSGNSQKWNKSFRVGNFAWLLHFQSAIKESSPFAAFVSGGRNPLVETESEKESVMRKLVLGLVVCCSLFIVSAASADTIPYSLSGSGWSSSGTFIGSPTAPGTWTVTGASGTFNGTNITGVCPQGTCNSAFVYDNLYFWPGPPNVDNSGIVVTLANGDWVNFCYDPPNCALPGGYAALNYNPNSGYTYFNADTVNFGQPVPEPGTLALLGTSLLGLAGVVRRRIF